MSAITAINVVKRGISQVTTNNLTVGNGSNSYNFPAVTGKDEQFLSLNDDSLIWTSGTPGSGIQGINNTDGNITHVGTTVVNLGLSPNIAVQQLTIENSSGDAQYILPDVSGSAGEVLTLGNDGITCEWGPGGTGGGVNSITSEDDNLTITPTGGTGNVSIEFSTDIRIFDIQGDTIQFVTADFENFSISSINTDANGKKSATPIYTLPTANGSAGQVITAGTEMCTWETPFNMLLSPNFRFDNTVTPKELYLQNDILVGNSVSSVIFRKVAPPPENGLLGDPTVLYDLPLEAGTAGQVITFPISGTQCIWADGDGTGTVTNVSSSDANIAVVNQSTTPVMTLNQDLTVTTLSVESVTASTEIFGANVYATNLGIADDSSTNLFTMPVLTTSPAQNNVIVSNNSGGSVFNNVGSLLENSTNITVTTDTNNKAIISLNDDVVVDNLTIGNTQPLVFPNTLTGVTNGYVLGNNNGNLEFISNGTGGGVSSVSVGTNMVVSPMGGTGDVTLNLNDNVSIVGGLTAATLEIGTDFPLVFPSSIENVTPGYVLGLSNGNIEFIPNEGGGGVTSVSVGTNMVVSPMGGTGDVTLNLNDNVSIVGGLTAATLEIGTDFPLVFPSSIENVTPGYVLGLNNGNIEFIENGTGTGGVTSISATDGNFSFDPTTGTGDVIISLNPEGISVGGLTIGSVEPLVFPNTLTNVTNGYVLGNNNGSLGFIQGGTITSVQQTTNQVKVDTTTPNAPKVGFFTGYNQTVFPANIITNSGTQGANSNVVSIGYNALNLIDNSFTNGLLVGIGTNAMNSLTSVTGLNQIVVGDYSGTELNATSNYNLVVGNQSLADTNNVSPQNNIVVGHYSGQDISNGARNIVVGHSSMSATSTSTTSVTDNIVIGNNSLQNITEGGNNNIVIGNNVNVPVANSSGNFIVEPSYVTSMQIGNILSGTAAQLLIPNMKNPFSAYPTKQYTALCSDNLGNLSWDWPACNTEYQTINNATFLDTAGNDYEMVFTTVTFCHINNTIMNKVELNNAISTTAYAPITVTGSSQTWVSQFIINNSFAPPSGGSKLIGTVLFSEYTNGNRTYEGYVSFYILFTEFVGYTLNLEIYDLNYDPYSWHTGCDYYFGVSTVNLFPNYSFTY